jgi:hypothetical protein
MDRALASGAKGRGFESLLARHFLLVRPGDIGDRSYRRHRLHFWAKRVVERLQSFFLQIDVAEIVRYSPERSFTERSEDILYAVSMGQRNGPSTESGIQGDPVLCFQVVVISVNRPFTVGYGQLAVLNVGDPLRICRRRRSRGNDAKARDF